MRKIKKNRAKIRLLFKYCKKCVSTNDETCASLGQVDGGIYPTYSVASNVMIPLLSASFAADPTLYSSFSACVGNDCNTPDLQCPSVLNPVSAPTRSPASIALSCYFNQGMPGSLTVAPSGPMLEYPQQEYQCVKYCQKCIDREFETCSSIGQITGNFYAIYSLLSNVEIPIFQNIDPSEYYSFSSCLGNNCNVPDLTCNNDPTQAPTSKPTPLPTKTPTLKPTSKPTKTPTLKPTFKLTSKPTFKPTSKPTLKPTSKPTFKPTSKPTFKPT